MFADELTKRHFLGVCFQSLHAALLTSDGSASAAASSIQALLAVAHERLEWIPSAHRPDLPTSVLCFDDESLAAVAFGGRRDDDCEDDEDGPVVVDLEATKF